MTTPSDRARSGSRRGRPVVLDPDARRARILDALEQVYQSAGLEAATMDAVARQAGMSKRTVYASFEDRTALLLAWLDRLVDSDTAQTDGAADDCPFEARLRRHLVPAAPASGYGLPLGIVHLLIVESAARPEIGRAFVRRVLERKRAGLLAFLQQAQARGDLHLPDLSEATDLMLDMVRPLLLNALLDPQHQPDPAALDRRFRLTLDLFRRAYGPGRGE